MAGTDPAMDCLRNSQDKDNIPLSMADLRPIRGHTGIPTFRIQQFQ